MWPRLSLCSVNEKCIVRCLSKPPVLSIYTDMHTRQVFSATASCGRSLLRNRCVLKAGVVRPVLASNTGTQSRCLSQAAEHSWAATNLKSTGEELTPYKKEKDKLLSEEVVRATPDEIKALSDELLSMNILEIQLFITTLQKRLGVSDEQMGSGGGGGGGGGGEAAAAEVVEEKTAFDVKLTGFDAKSKIKIIKEVRAATGLGLKEAKDLVESAGPTCNIKQGLTKDEAEALMKTITDLGGQVELV